MFFFFLCIPLVYPVPMFTPFIVSTGVLSGNVMDSRKAIPVPRINSSDNEGLIVNVIGHCPISKLILICCRFYFGFVW